MSHLDRVDNANFNLTIIETLLVAFYCFLCWLDFSIACRVFMPALIFIKVIDTYPTIILWIKTSCSNDFFIIWTHLNSLPHKRVQRTQFMVWTLRGIYLQRCCVAVYYYPRTLRTPPVVFISSVGDILKTKKKKKEIQWTSVILHRWSFVCLQVRFTVKPNCTVEVEKNRKRKGMHRIINH